MAVRVAARYLDELPERRRETLLWQFALVLDYDEVDELVRERGPFPCRIRSRKDPQETAALLGDDGRWHLDIDGRLLCSSRSTHGGHRHDQHCHWWTDGHRYLLQPPRGMPPKDTRPGSSTREVRWVVNLTDRPAAAPESIPRTQRCPINARLGHWPVPEDRGSPLGRTRALLRDRLGPLCNGCGTMPGTLVDHDHFDGMVRGLLCPNCNSHVDACPHLYGCPWADYLNNPPAAPLQLSYPGHSTTIRNAQAKIDHLGLNPFAQPSR